MYEFSFKLNDKSHRINAKSIEEVKRLSPEATNIVKGNHITQCILVPTPPKGIVIDPGRAS